MAVDTASQVFALTVKVAALRSVLSEILDEAVASGLIERQRGMIGPSLLDALDALDLTGEFLSSTEPE